MPAGIAYPGITPGKAMPEAVHMAAHVVCQGCEP